MRVTGGVFGGRKLLGPLDSSLRPTSDRTRQAIFNILRHNDLGVGFSLAEALALDLFAGTGALGIEALSQGALWCLFVDDSPASRAILRQNIEALALTGKTRIWRRDATNLGPIGGASGGPFNLVFLDPPYHKNLIPAALASLKTGGWLASKAILVVESAADEPFCADGFGILQEREYGDTRVRFVAET